MEQIEVQLQDRGKAKILIEFLKVLDFVDSVKITTDYECSNTMTELSGTEIDFFALAGLWSDRDISMESIRQQAWPRQLQ